jgi:hypothetical protein
MRVLRGTTAYHADVSKEGLRFRYILEKPWLWWPGFFYFEVERG